MSATQVLMSNTLTAETVTAVACPAIVTDIEGGGYGKYLVDESRRAGTAAAVALPRSTAELCGAVLAARKQGWAITVSGARTGIAAGAVPEGGLVVSLERMNRVCGLRRSVTGDLLVRCEAGVVLGDLQQAVRSGKFADSATWDRESLSLLEDMRTGPRLTYPPDPTETSASVGGTVACNASGAHTFLYGPTRRYVQSLKVVLVDGSVLDIERDAASADENGRFALRRSDGTAVTGCCPSYRQPDAKSAAGYFSGERLDLIDLFIGSEGTLGIIAEVELRLVSAPGASCAAFVFCPSEDAALRFTQELRAVKTELGVEAIEYFGPRALGMLRGRRATLGAASGVPACLPSDAACGVYLDIGCDAESLPASLGGVAEIAERCGSDPAVCWSAMEREERERLRLFRHALPETVNSLIADIRKQHPTVTKLGTDMSVPDAYLTDVVSLYRSKLDRHELQYVVFGHIGNNHLHVNILPRTPDEYALGKTLYLEFARDVVRMGGSVSAEHGIGKLKVEFLEIMLGEKGIAEMREVKRVFDPEFRLGKGTLFR